MSDTEYKNGTGAQWRREMHPNHFVPKGPEELPQDNFMSYNVETNKFRAGHSTLFKKLAEMEKKEMEPKTGNKLDGNKPQVSLIPSEAILEMATAFTYGAKKYEADNFKLGIKYRRLIDAAMRHLLAISAGEDVDSESNNKHVAHCMASLAMLTYMMYNKPEMDDRYKGGSK